MLRDIAHLDQAELEEHRPLEPSTGLCDLFGYAKRGGKLMKVRHIQLENQI